MGSNKLLQSRTGALWGLLYLSNLFGGTTLRVVEAPVPDKIPPIFEKKVVLKYCLRGYNGAQNRKTRVPPNPYRARSLSYFVYVFSRGREWGLQMKVVNTCFQINQ